MSSVDEAHGVGSSQSTIEEGDVEKEQHGGINDFANGGPVQETDAAQHAQQKESGDVVVEDAGGGSGGGAVEKQVTQVSAKPSVHSLRSIPNGGLQAWLQVLGAFFLFFNSWGVTNTFGVYQTYYETGILASSSPSDISWIGSVQAMLLLFVGALTGPIYDAGHFKMLVRTGSFLVVFGQMMLSLCKEYYQVLLAQAFCIGIGAGCLFVPSVAIISQYFTTKIATAMGIAAVGSSLGGVIYPIVLYRLLPQVGFGWSTRVIGFILLATLIVPNVFMKVRILPAQKRKIVDVSALKEPAYALWVTGTFLGFTGLYAPFFYIESYSISTGIMKPNLGFYLIPILNAASIFGRALPNIMADKIGPYNMLIPCSIMTAVLNFVLIGTHNTPGIIIVTLLYGFFSGTFVSLPPTIFVALSPNRGIIGTRMGMGFTITSIGLLIGTPSCGWILNAAGWKYVWIFGGTMALAGSVFIILSRMVQSKWTLVTKV
ncbi:MAG: hypothetical protein M1821_002405 [Bathelium mastoideum]|nr:MAG: hypothetical protein M1821_002405 [Bathelium mastoideum]KAI9686385.1 MAG: hypothetical protein M1822_003730 [Bathelium mastoideum]